MPLPPLSLCGRGVGVRGFAPAGELQKGACAPDPSSGRASRVHLPPQRGKGFRLRAHRSRRRPRGCAEPQLPRAVEPQRRVGRGDDDSAAAQARLHGRRESGLGGGVERGRRFVEQPKRAIGDEETGERHAPPLPGREQAGGEIDHMRETDLRQAPPLARRARIGRRAWRRRRRGSRPRSGRL